MHHFGETVQSSGKTTLEEDVEGLKTCIPPQRVKSPLEMWSDEINGQFWDTEGKVLGSFDLAV